MEVEGAQDIARVFSVPPVLRIESKQAEPQLCTWLVIPALGKQIHRLTRFNMKLGESDLEAE
jgi:hypothetical protein